MRTYGYTARIDALCDAGDVQETRALRERRESWLPARVEELVAARGAR